MTAGRAPGSRGERSRHGTAAGRDVRPAYAAALRTLAMRPEALSRTAPAPAALPGAAALLAAVPADPDAASRAVWRGRIDALALRIRFSDARLHSATAPPADPQQALFDRFEQARVEAIGALLPGVRANIAAQLAGEPPLPGAPLLRAARARWHAPLPPAESGAAATAGGIGAEATRTIEAMAGLLHDQWAFALQALTLVALAVDPQNAAQAEPAPGAEPDDARGNPSNPASAAAPRTPAGESGDDGLAGVRRLDAAAQPRESANRSGHELPGYRIFTREFDRTIDAQDMRCHPAAVFPPSDRQRAALRAELTRGRANFARWAHRLQRHLLARQLRSWEFDLDEGVLDAARLTRVVTDPAQPLSFKRERDGEFLQTAVTLLIDCSGSMRGLPIATAAGCAELLAAVLERCDVRAEVLGFTTRQWRGGESRARWLAEGRPRDPGRLTDLLHVVFKRADTPWRRARHSLEKMLDEDLLKENIDGEALLWAYERTLRRSEPRRILMVISDGAPLDDATLAANGPGYLDRHLRAVVRQMEARGAVELLAIGIGHDVGAYYRHSFAVDGPDNLGEAIVTQLIGLLDGGRRGSRRRRRIPAGGCAKTLQ
jgi:cobaltochelatase CobT